MFPLSPTQRLAVWSKRWALLWWVASVGAAAHSADVTPDWLPLHQQVTEQRVDNAPADAAPPDASVGELYVFALRALDRHRTSVAEAAFTSIITRQPDYVPARWGLAEVARRRGRVEECLDELALLVQESPGFAPAAITLGYIQLTRGKYGDAIATAEKVLALGRERVDRDNYARALVLVAGAKGLLAQQGGWVAKLQHGTRVLSYLKRAEAVSPDEVGVLLGMGSFRLLAPGIAGGDLDTAISYLERAIDRDPLLADAYVRLAQAWSRKGDVDKSQAYLAQALRVDPDNPLALQVSAESK